MYQSNGVGSGVKRLLKMRASWSAWLRKATRYVGTFRGRRLWLAIGML